MGDGDGLISAEEAAAAGISKEQMAMLDLDHDGTIDQDEFLKMTGTLETLMDGPLIGNFQGRHAPTSQSPPGIPKGEAKDLGGKEMDPVVSDDLKHVLTSIIEEQVSKAVKCEIQDLQSIAHTILLKLENLPDSIAKHAFPKGSIDSGISEDMVQDAKRNSKTLKRFDVQSPSQELLKGIVEEGIADNGAESIEAQADEAQKEAGAPRTTTKYGAESVEAQACPYETITQINPSLDRSVIEELGATSIMQKLARMSQIRTTQVGRVATDGDRSAPGEDDREEFKATLTDFSKKRPTVDQKKRKSKTGGSALQKSNTGRGSQVKDESWR